MAQYQPYQQTYAQPHYSAQPYRRHPEETDSLGSWMLAVFLMMIPVVGFIYLLVLAFGGTDSIAKKNYARATLLWSAILLVLGIVATIIMATAGIAFFSGLEDSSGITNY